MSVKVSKVTNIEFENIMDDFEEVKKHIIDLTSERERERERERKQEPDMDILNDFFASDKEAVLRYFKILNNESDDDITEDEFFNSL